MTTFDQIKNALGITANPSEVVCQKCGLQGSHKYSCPDAPSKEWKAALLSPASNSDNDKRALIAFLMERHPEIAKAETPEAKKEAIRDAVQSDLPIVSTWQRFNGKTVRDLEAVMIDYYFYVKGLEPKPTHKIPYKDEMGGKQFFVITGDFSPQQLLGFKRNQEAEVRVRRRAMLIAEAQRKAEREAEKE